MLRGTAKELAVALVVVVILAYVAFLIAVAVASIMGTLEW